MGQVDVLAVLDELLLADYGYMARSGRQEVTIGYSKAAHDRAIAARGAVAELINALEHIAGSCEGRAAEVAGAALARVGGAA